jgi:hypothetical protein
LMSTRITPSSFTNCVWSATGIANEAAGAELEHPDIIDPHAYHVGDGEHEGACCKPAIGRVVSVINNAKAVMICGNTALICGYFE